MRPDNQQGRGLPPFVADERARDISRETDACDTALRTLLSQLGPWADRLVLVGGLSPRYIVPVPPDGIDPHMGTTDIDLVLRLAVPEGAGSPDVSLAEQLHSLGFSPKMEPELPGGPAFRWVRDVKGFKVKVEFMCPAAGRQGLTVDPDPLPNVGEELGALRLTGAELVGLDYVERELTGPTMGGDEVRVRLRVTDLVPFLVLKAFALDERNKDKDAYDIVWLLSAYPEGPSDAARAALESPVVDELVVRDAIVCLRAHFSHPEGRGPELYAAAFGGVHVVKRRTLQRYAYRTVQEFLKVWDRERMPSDSSHTLPPGVP